jgi:hypothetical protein
LETVSTSWVQWKLTQKFGIAGFPAKASEQPSAKTYGGAQVNGKYSLMKIVVPTCRKRLDSMVGHPPWVGCISHNSCGAIAVVSGKVFRPGSIVNMFEGRDTFSTQVS